MTGHRSRLILLCMAVALALSACTGGTAPTPSLDGQVVLGVAVPLSGDLADFGLTIAQGVQLAAADQNAKGGVLGREVVVKVVDDGASADKAAKAAEELVAADAAAVVGHFNSGASIAAAPIYAGAGVLQITPTSTNPKLTELGIPTVFRVTPTDSAQGPALAAAMAADGRRRVAVLYADANTYAQGLQEQVRSALAASGIDVASVQSFPKGTRDWTPYLQAAAASGADSLLLVAEAPQASEVVLQARDLGLSLPVYGGDSMAKLEFLYRSGSAAEGATITSLLPNLVSGEAKDSSLVTEYRDRFGRNPGLDTPAGQVAAETWFRAATEAGSFDAAAVARVLKGGFSFDSPIGRIAYDTDGDLQDQTIHVNVVSGGQLVARS